MIFFKKDYKFVLIIFLVIAVGLILPETLTLLFVTALFAVIAIINPKYAILALIVYFPIRPFLVEVNLGFRWAGDITIIFMLLNIVFMYRKNLLSLFKLRIFEWSYLVFCLFGAAIAFNTGVSLAAIVFQVRAFLILFILFYIVKRINITKEDIQNFAWTSIATAIVVSGHGIIERISLRQWLLPEGWINQYISPTNIMRIYGLTGNPNSLALYITMVMILCLYLLPDLTGRAKIFAYSVLSLFSGVLLLTYSRGTWLAVAFAMVIYLLLSKNWKIMKPLVIAGILGSLLVYIPTNITVEYIEAGGLIEVDESTREREPGLSGRLQETFDDETLERSRTGGRIYYVEKGLEVFKQYPITGTGFGTFGDSATLVYSSPIYEKLGTELVIPNFYSDNQYIQIIAQNGVIGVILFAVFLLGMLHYIWINRKENLPIAYFMIALLLGTYLSGFYYNIWELKVYTLYYFIFLGAYASISEKPKEN